MKYVVQEGQPTLLSSRMSEKTLNKMKQKAKAQDQPRAHVAYPWEDVGLIIGAPGAARNIYGMKGKADVPQVDDFKEWLTVTLDISRPGK